MKKLFTSALVVMLIGAVNSTLQAVQASQQQQKPQSQQQAQQPAQPAPKPPRVVGQAQTQEEYQAYQSITQTSDAQQRASLLEDFFKKYPDSGLTFWLQLAAASTYQQLNNYERLVEHGEAALKSFAADEAALTALKASPAVILTMLANAYAMRGKSDLALDRAEKAIAAINNLQAPAQVDATQFTKEKNQLLETAYTSRGMAHVAKAQETRAKKAAEPKNPAPADHNNPPATAPKKEDVDLNLDLGIADLKKAIELNPKDELAYFQLGVAYTLKNDAENAIDSYARTVAIGGFVANLAKENLEKVYKITHNNSLDGLDQRIAKAKEALNTPASTTPPPPPAASKPPGN